MCDCCERWFFKFYPAVRKEAYTAEGFWMRKISLVSCIIHNLLFVFCLALVGAGPMILNFLQAMWTYSVFLTLREREMAVYLLLLAGQIGQCITMILGGNCKGMQ